MRGTGNEMQPVQKHTDFLSEKEKLLVLFFPLLVLLYSLSVLFLFWSFTLTFPFFFSFLLISSLTVYTPQQNFSNNIKIAV